MIRIGLCDDQKEVIELLEKSLNKVIAENNYKMKVVLATTSLQEMYTAVEKNEVNVLFLDINFNQKNLSGIDFAKKLREINKSFYLIFFTAFFEYTLDTFKCKTFDYIIKPATTEKLNNTLSRLYDDYYSSKTKIIHFNNNISLNENDIVYIEKDKHTLIIHTLDNTVYTTYGKLSDYETTLSANFVRSHRSCIVNKTYIKRVDKKAGTIHLVNDLTCQLSKPNSKLF